MQRLFFQVLLFLPVLSFAQLTPRMVDGPRGNKVGFYEFLPPGYAEHPEEKHPLIIFLHGIGEKGNGREPDLNKINCCGIPKYITEDGNAMRFTWMGKTESFVVLYPQLASKYGTWEMYYIDALIRYAKKNLNIDTNRIFLTGLSLGGGGTWVYASASLKNARQFAGIAPVVAPCFMTNGCNIANANLPVLTVHAMDDPMANPHCTIDAIKSITDCGAAVTPNFVMYITGGHYIWKQRAYDTAYNYFNPNIYEWMLAQNRLFKPNKKPIADAGKNITVSTSTHEIKLDATNSKDPDGKVVRYVWQRVSGPSVGLVRDEVTATPTIVGLSLPGVYTFRVRVIDDRAEWSTADVKITVVDATIVNRRN